MIKEQMNKSFTVCFLLGFTISCYCQIYADQEGDLHGQIFVDKQGFELFREGSMLLERGQYQQADSY